MYQDWYHELINNAVLRPYEQSTRDNLAYRLRNARLLSRAARRNLSWDIGRISWPIKRRPNGRYS